MNDELRAFIEDIKVNPYRDNDGRYFISRISDTRYQLVTQDPSFFNSVILWTFHTDGTFDQRVHQHVSANCRYHGPDGPFDITDKLVNAGTVIGIYYPQETTDETTL